MPDSALYHALATALVAGELEVEAIVARCTRLCGRNFPWFHPLARRFVAACEDRPRPRHREALRFLRENQTFRRAARKDAASLAIVHRVMPPVQMQPVEAAVHWNLPAVETPGALAEWLSLTTAELDWFADLKALTCASPSPKLGHYHYRLLEKGSGGVRLIESPKPRLKRLQRQILSAILDRIPPHNAAHGFVKGRSIRSFTAPHAGRRVILRMDLRDFFPTISGARIQTVFRTFGYPEPVSDLLGGICTNATPRDAGISRDDWLYQRPHLPQGAPTSPSLANVCFYRADCRLTGLADSAGAQYTRYADDLAFSGPDDFDRRVDRFTAHVAAILHEEGFEVHHRKTRVMRPGVRQHLAGVVLNQHANVYRADFDRLKAILTNCLRHGPASQNRDGHPDFRAHLTGRVAYVEMINPRKAQRLRKLLDAVQWT